MFVCSSGCYAGMALQEGQAVLLEVALKNVLPSHSPRDSICIPCSEGETLGRSPCPGPAGRGQGAPSTFPGTSQPGVTGITVPGRSGSSQGAQGDNQEPPAQGGKWGQVAQGALENEMGVSKLSQCRAGEAFSSWVLGAGRQAGGVREWLEHLQSLHRSPKMASLGTMMVL